MDLLKQMEKLEAQMTVRANRISELELELKVLKAKNMKDYTTWIRLNRASEVKSPNYK